MGHGLIIYASTSGEAPGGKAGGENKKEFQKNLKKVLDKCEAMC